MDETISVPALPEQPKKPKAKKKPAKKKVAKVAAPAPQPVVPTRDPILCIGLRPEGATQFECYGMKKLDRRSLLEQRQYRVVSVTLDGDNKLVRVEEGFIDQDLGNTARLMRDQLIGIMHSIKGSAFRCTQVTLTGDSQAIVKVEVDPIVQPLHLSRDLMFKKAAELMDTV